MVQKQAEEQQKKMEEEQKKQEEDLVSNQEEKYDLLKDLDVNTWKTYESKKVGVKIKYPEDWEIVELENEKAGFALRSPKYIPTKSGIVIYDGEIYVDGHANPKQLSIENLFNTFDDGSGLLFSRYEHEDIVINRWKGVYFPNIDDEEESYNILGDKQMFSFDYEYQKNEKISEISQILKKIVENFEPL